MVQAESEKLILLVWICWSYPTQGLETLDAIPALSQCLIPVTVHSFMTVDHCLILFSSQSVSEQSSLEFISLHPPFYFVIEPNAIISAVYTPVPGEDPEKFELNKFTAGNILMLNCTVRGSSGDFTYQWSRVRNLIFEDCCDNATSTLVVPLYSDNAGSYTCIVNESWTSKYFTVSVIGELCSVLTHHSLQSVYQEELQLCCEEE